MIFKKTIHIILAFVILATTTGFTINFHYCHNKVVAVSIDHKIVACCDIANSCCSDAVIHIKLTNDFLSSSLAISKQLIQPYSNLFSVNDCKVSNIELINSFDKHLVEIPPLEQDLLLLYQVFLI